MYMYKECFDAEVINTVINSHKSHISSRLKELGNSINATFLSICTIRDAKLKSVLTIKNAEEFEATPFILDFYKQHLQKETYTKECETYSHNSDRLMSADLINESEQNVGVVIVHVDKLELDVAITKLLFRNFVDYLTTFIQKSHLLLQKNSQLSLLNQTQVLSKTGAWEHNLKRNRTYLSNEVYRIFGLPIGESLSISKVIGFYATQHRVKMKKALTSLIKFGTPYDIELRLLDAQNEPKWVRAVGTAERDENSEITRIYGAFEDVSTHKKLSIESENRASKLNNILNSINDAVFTINTEGVITHTNKIAEDMFGYTAVELLGQKINKLMPEPYSSHHDHYMKKFEQTGKAKIMGVGRQLPALKKGGEVFHMELSLSEAYDKGKKHYIGIVRDISERLKSEDAIYNLAFTDSVTDLRNSQWFEREATTLMYRAIREKHVIFTTLINIDNMSTFNRQFGFKQGDKALKIIADKLKLQTGSRFAVYKYTADSFIIIANETFNTEGYDNFDLGELENLLLKSNNYQINLEGTEHQLTASMSSAFLNPQNHFFESMLSVLEHAMSIAKKDSPYGKYHVDNKNISEHDRKMIVKGLLSHDDIFDEFSLELQPQYNVDSKLVAFEALIRWYSQALGWVSPAEFIPIAEEGLTINKIGKWVIEKACKALNRLCAPDYLYSISINISARQFIMPDFEDTLLSITSHYSVPRQCLVLELTETTLVSDIEHVKRSMLRLSKYGFRFSIDDFGTGYSSLAYLKELPISELKIDKYFIDDIQIHSDNESYPIVDAIINMAKALSVQCIAEGVENKQQVDYLKTQECFIYQGYFYSKPLQIEACHNLIASEKKKQITLRNSI